MPVRPTLVRLLGSLLGGSLLSGIAVAASPPPTHGPVIAEATEDAAVIWLRAPAEGTLTLKVRPRPVAGGSWTVAPDPARDLTARVALSRLRPDTRYTVTARYEAPGEARSEPVVASFRTAPAATDVRPVRFAMSGDLGGQGRCRRLGPDGAELGYPIFGAIAALRPDFFVMNGDQIYADSLCLEAGPEENELGAPWRNVPGPARDVRDEDVSWTSPELLREIFWQHWRYNRAELHYQAMLRQTVFYAQWDDHEVINDHGMAWGSWRRSSDRPGYATLVQEGVAAFHDYNPVSQASADQRGIYRSFRWGADVELFLLDARTFRSANADPDSPEAAKSMLGAAQRAWLLAGLRASDATFKIISVDVPLAQPTGSQPGENGRDGWADGADDAAADEGAAATGFERELRGILLELDRAQMKNLVFLAADVHFAQIARFSPDLDGDGQPLIIHEIIAGPLSAGASKAVTPDPSFAPEVLYAEGGLFNFAWITVDRPSGKPTLTVQILGEDGTPRPGGELVLPAR